jgi:hypothetical protein
LNFQFLSAKLAGKVMMRLGKQLLFFGGKWHALLRVVTAKEGGIGLLRRFG